MSIRSHGSLRTCNCGSTAASRCSLRRDNRYIVRGRDMARAQSGGRAARRALDLSRRKGVRRLLCSIGGARGDSENHKPRSHRPGRGGTSKLKKRLPQNAHAAFFFTGLKYKESLRALLSAISEPSEKARPQYFTFFRSQSRPTM